MHNGLVGKTSLGQHYSEDLHGQKVGFVLYVSSLQHVSEDLQRQFKFAGNLSPLQQFIAESQSQWSGFVYQVSGGDLSSQQSMLESHGQFSFVLQVS